MSAFGATSSSRAVVRVRESAGKSTFQDCVAHRSELQRPELLCGLAVVLGLGMQTALQLRWPDALDTLAITIVGLVLVVLGLLLVHAAHRTFVQAKQTPAPGYASTRLIRTGIFRYSRNPTSVGFLVALIGLVFLLQNIGIALAILPYAVLTNCILIKPEEAYLEHVFGKDYRLYKHRVRRWL